MATGGMGGFLVSIKETLTGPLQKRKLSKEIEEYKAALEQNPKDLRIHMKLGEAYLKMGEEQAAVEEYTFVANSYAQEGVLIKAIAIDKMLLRIDPSLQGISQKLAELYKQGGLTGELEQATSTTPSSGEAGAKRISIPLFSELSQTELTEVMKKITVRHFPPGTPVINQGDPGESMFIINDGEVKVVRKDHGGHEILLHTLKDGEFFGEISLLSGKPRIASVITIEESEILEISKQDLDDVVAKFPGVKKILIDFYETRLEETKAVLKAQT
ncbi:MAG: cyclic nucleotide-binding domain-containing protein [Candidatus Tectomicrobia bacterium]|nr:cyclic nucleotide-binding domain-containing protein [Candidatus Tectomicrobia bacterium]